MELKNIAKIEKKWQEYWEKKGLNKISDSPKGKKKYVLDMFPYPSGATMHVGHLEGYIATDIFSRYLRMNGYSVLHPMGWDAFGLPAENYAIKTGLNPSDSTSENIKTFKRQLGNSGLSYDWSREISTSDPDFYKWTQWLFILMFKRGLAYKKKAPVNWCPKDETVLANEQVINGKCERCDTQVIKKELDQWFFKITAYADRLIDGLDRLDWLEEVKIQQKNWIGKKVGINISYPIEKSKEIVTCFTSRPDTNFGASFIVLSPNHPLVLKITTVENKENVKKYIKEYQNANGNAEIEYDTKEKTGVFTGAYAVNRLNDEKLPIWISDYVLEGVGTGAVVGVPGHDKRDFEFAQKFGIKVTRVVSSTPGDTSPIKKLEDVFEGEGKVVNSRFLNGLDSREAMQKIISYLEERKWGKRHTSYHLRDWLISRQRYWGAPIPMVYCKKCGWQPVPESDLPIKLPIDVDFRPHGKSPLATSKTFQNGAMCPECGGEAEREVDTMDTFVDSSWYFIRFVDPKNTKELADQERIKAWLPVDVYVGGGHVVQHLLFARFFWKVMFDEGLLDKSIGDEPFLKLRAPGWILGPDSRKMSKRWGNVITPDDIIPKFGADVLRLYEMFMGPFEIVKPWNITGVEGMNRFVHKIWTLFEAKQIKSGDREMTVKMHQTIKKVTNDVASFRFNTAISAIMEYVNMLKEKGATKENHEILTKLLAPFAPHLMEEVWQEVMGHTTSVHKEKWPNFESKYIEEHQVTIIVQINGRMRDQIIIEATEGENQDKVYSTVVESEKVKKYIDGKKIKKVIFVPKKVINLVI